MSKSRIKVENIKIFFGKHKGKKLVDLPDDYLAWLHFKWKRDDGSDYLNRAALQVLEDKGLDAKEVFEKSKKKVRRRGVPNMDDERWASIGPGGAEYRADFLGNCIIRTWKEDWDGDPDNMYDYEGIPNFD